MIRLIASDMDGTLLDENSQVPEETFGLIRALGEKGVRFCVSSGRRYDELRNFFFPVRDKMDYVASNGSQVYADGHVVDREVFSAHSVNRLFEMCETYPCLHLTLYDRINTYVYDDKDIFPRHLKKTFARSIRLTDPPSPDVNIIKASIFSDAPEETPDLTIALTRELGDRLAFMPSGPYWIDVTPYGVSKATGIKEVLRYYGISPDEVVHFGDSLNDFDILRFVGYPFVVENGSYAVKQIARRIVPSNADHGVQQTMREILESL